jgi:hypothetical protein
MPIKAREVWNSPRQQTPGSKSQQPLVKSQTQKSKAENLAGTNNVHSHNRFDALGPANDHQTPQIPTAIIAEPTEYPNCSQ